MEIKELHGVAKRCQIAYIMVMDNLEIKKPKLIACTYRVPVQIIAAVKRLAIRDHRSINQEIVVLLEDAIAAESTAEQECQNVAASR